LDYLGFTRWVDGKQSILALPPDCVALVPHTNYRVLNSVLWTFIWVLHFTSDNRYLRIWEHHDKAAGLIGESRRLHFVYHYGPLTKFDDAGSPEVDEMGVPRYNSADPVDIRVDNICPGGRPHLHFGGPNPHYQQRQIDGLDLEALDMFSFIAAILKHREKAVPIEKVMRFRLI
jgi:hypothetical protein